MYLAVVDMISCIVVTPYIQSFKEILVNYTHSKNQNQERNLL